MTDYKDIFLAILAILVPAIVAILGYVIHRKTERIKIMENQLSDKKYQAYAGLVGMFLEFLRIRREAMCQTIIWQNRWLI
ncbi:MAG: hypothetical protein K2M94_02850 [Paramuribaculum sp.]|nr:hypothetical protein [Paramuribaculum sp.]